MYPNYNTMGTEMYLQNFITISKLFNYVISDTIKKLFIMIY